MKIKIYFTIFFISISINSFSQLIQKTNRLHVGDITPADIINTSAALDISSTSKGFLPPRMTETQMNNITTPAIGLIVYCTDCTPEGLKIYKSGNGFYGLTNATSFTGFKVEKTTDFSLIKGGKKIVTDYDTDILNPGSNFNLTTGLYTVTVDGAYLVSGMLNLDNGDGGDDTMYMYLDKNGTTETSIKINPRFDTSNTTQASYTLSTIMNLSVGDVIRLSYGGVHTNSDVKAFDIHFFAALIRSE